MNWKSSYLESQYHYYTLPSRQAPRGRSAGGFVYGWKKLLDFPIQVISTSNTHILIQVEKIGNLLFPYVPPTSHTPMMLETLFEKIPTLPTTIIMGDMNGRVGTKQTNPLFPRNSMDIKSNPNGEKILSLARRANLVIGNGYLDGDREGKITCINKANGGMSVVDLLLVTPEILPEIIKFEILDWTDSDHFPLLLTLKTEYNNKQSKIYPVSTKGRMVIPTTDPQLHLFTTTLNSKLPEICTLVDADAAGAALHVAFKQSCQSLGLLKFPKPMVDLPKWFDGDCKTAKWKKNIALRNLRQNYDPTYTLDLAREYLRRKKEYKNVIQAKKEHFHTTLTAKLSQCNDPSSFWKAVKYYNRKQPVVPRISKEKWYDHYSKVFNCRDQERWGPPDLSLPSADPILDREFNPLEVQLAVKSVKVRKAPGPDLIPNEAWKLRLPALLLHLLTLFQLCFDSGKVPLSWCQAHIVPIYKKGFPDDPCNYRPISLLSTTLKLFTRILNSRLVQWISHHDKISDFQGGFRKGRSCADHVFTLMCISQSQLLKNKDTFLCFVDLAQAFDTPNHNLLWSVLQKMGVSTKFIRIFKYIYDNATASVLTPSGTTEPFKIMKGVLQGESASPTLFNLFIEELSTKFEKALLAPFTIFLRKIHLLLYADDLVLIAHSKELLQEKMKIAANFFHSRGLTVNINKTKVLIIRRSGRIKKEEKTFTWRADPVETVKYYVYLGVTFQSNGLFTLQSENAVSKGIAATAAVLGVLRKIKNMNLKSSKYLLNAIIKSTSLYCSGIWGIEYADQLEAVQQNFYKKLLHLPRSTPRYFIRLETGSSLLKMDVMKLAISFYTRILDSSKDGLLYNAYTHLRRTSARIPILKYSWCLQLEIELKSVNLEHLYRRESLNTVLAYKDILLHKLRCKYAESDLLSVSISTTLPHYSQLKTRLRPEPFLLNSMPAYLVTPILQVRLNYNSVYINGEWHNVGHFAEKMCSWCGDTLSFSHLLWHCSGTEQTRQKLFPRIPENPIEIIRLVSDYSRNPDAPLRLLKLIQQAVQH
jgi:hypothetical protein